MNYSAYKYIIYFTSAYVTFSYYYYIYIEMVTMTLGPWMVASSSSRRGRIYMYTTSAVKR